MKKLLLDGSVFEFKQTGIAKATKMLYQALEKIRPGIIVDIAHSKRILGQVGENGPEDITTMNQRRLIEKIFKHFYQGRMMSQSVKRAQLLNVTIIGFVFFVKRFDDCPARQRDAFEGLPVRVQ